VNRGEVWRLRLDHGTPKAAVQERLVLILSTDALAVLPLRLVVPLVAWREDFSTTPWLVRVPPVLNSGLEEVMAADALQVRSVSTARLSTRLGSLPERVTALVAQAVAEITR
jgi:mRNA interferase MazF